MIQSIRIETYSAQQPILTPNPRFNMTVPPLLPTLLFSALFLLGCGSREEAQQAIRETLRQQGYRPPATGQGGIRDLSSWVRIQVVMETNAAMAHGISRADMPATCIRVGAM